MPGRSSRKRTPTCSTRFFVSEPLLSVIICTHNRPWTLRRCLESVSRLADPVEVIVVDSASSSPVGALAAECGCRYHYEAQPGLSRARNAGLRLATTPIVAFIDDDTELLPEWAREIIRPFEAPHVACVGGSCLALFDVERPRWLSDRLLQYAGITRLGTTSRLAHSRLEYPFGANLALRRHVALSLGGFREDLGRVGTDLLSGEETALLDALANAGHSIHLQPSAALHHHVPAERCRPGYYWRRLWWQGVSRAREGVTPTKSARLLLALPLRLTLWLATRDRFYLYRSAETAGYLATVFQR